MDLLECRKELDGIDRQIVELFEKRMEICGHVAESKLASGKAVYDGERERQKLEAVEAMAHGDFNRTAVTELFSQMMTISRRYQYKLLEEGGKSEDLGFRRVEGLPAKGARIVYQGVEGAYSHGAALQYFGEEADVYHVEHFGDAMEEVQAGRADFAVLPIENSSAGAVVDLYDILTRYSNSIVAETFLPVNHALLGTAEAEEEQIKTVYSHPQALMQSSEYLNSHRDWKQISMENTAVAARKVLEDGDPTQAAVASEIAGRLYGLKVLKPSIQNNKGNTTRFVILAREQVYRRDAGKISICFELPHESGTLYNMLSHIIYNGLNMTKIESRPIPGKSWEYRFFVDFTGKLGESAVENALRGIEAEANVLRVLGNY